MSAPRFCQCGCGSVCKSSKSRWLPGHFARDPERNAAFRAKVKEACSNEDHRRRLAAKLSEKWKSGTRRPNPPSARAKASESLKRAYAEGRVKPVDPATRSDAGRRGGGARSPLQIANARKQAALSKGKVGVGRNAPTATNSGAKGWVIRSPEGVTYRFRNLSLWVREHIHLFVDDRPWATSPLAARVTKGLGYMFGSDGRSCSHRGWTPVTQVSLERSSP